jgi:hypothetical protein
MFDYLYTEIEGKKWKLLSSKVPPKILLSYINSVIIPEMVETMKTADVYHLVISDIDIVFSSLWINDKSIFDTCGFWRKVDYLDSLIRKNIIRTLK